MFLYDLPKPSIDSGKKWEIPTFQVRWLAQCVSGHNLHSKAHVLIIEKRTVLHEIAPLVVSVHKHMYLLAEYVLVFARPLVTSCSNACAENRKRAPALACSYVRCEG